MEIEVSIGSFKPPGNNAKVQRTQAGTNFA